jgi:hypothetical protein
LLLFKFLKIKPMKPKLTFLAAALGSALAFIPTLARAAELDRTVIPLPEPKFEWQERRHGPGDRNQ